MERGDEGGPLLPLRERDPAADADPRGRGSVRGWKVITTVCKRLAEVEFPIAVVSKNAAREKTIRHGHPSTLHLWWARRPLAACRAVLFASLVDDPGEYIADEAKAHMERERLFRIIEE